MNDKYVFISYSSAEYTEANLVRSVLTENGISCWMAPESIPIGSSYATEISVAIENCTVFVLVLSDNAQKSPWVEKELDGAINCHKVVYPFVIENCKLNTTFNFYLSNVQRHAAFESKSAAMEKMVRDIKALFGTPVTENAELPKAEEKVDVKAEEKVAPVPTEPVKETETPKETEKKDKKSKLRNFFYKLTPYSRKSMQEKDAKFALTVSTVFWAILATPMFLMITEVDYYNAIPLIFKLLYALLCTLLSWHVIALFAGWFSKLRIKNRFFYKLFVFVLCAVAANVLTIVVIGAGYGILDNIAEEIAFGRMYY